jgi:hypothetical protein
MLSDAAASALRDMLHHIELAGRFVEGLKPSLRLILKLARDRAVK